MTERALEKLSDGELFSRFAAGEQQAFSEVVSRYKNQVYAFLRRFVQKQEVIEDIFQETFLQLYTSRDSFDRSRSLRPWLFTIAANKTKDVLRKQQRRATVLLGAISEPDEMSIDDVLNVLTSYESTPYDEVGKNETAAMVRQIVAEMPDNLQEILILSYFEGFSYKQMAEILGIPIGTVKSRLHTAVAHFAKKWSAVSEDEET